MDGSGNHRKRLEDSHDALDGHELHRPACVDLYLDVRSSPRAGEKRAALAAALRAGTAPDPDAVHFVFTER